MHNLKHFSKEDVEQLEAAVGTEDVLKSLDYHFAKIERTPEKWKSYCPIHKETIFRSLIIEIPKKTFRCSFIKCPGHRGGTLLDLYSLATGKDEIETVEYWAKKTGIQVRKRDVPKQDEDPGEKSAEQLAKQAEEPAMDQVEFVLDTELEEETETPVEEEAPEPDTQPIDLEGVEEAFEVIDLVEEETEAPAEEEAEPAAGEPPFEEPSPVEEQAPAPVAPKVERTAEQYATASAHLLAEGKPEQALELLEEGLEKNPNHPEILLAKVRVLREQNQDDAAFEILLKARELYTGRRIPEGRLRAGHQMLEIHPEDPAVYEDLAEAHLDRHENSQALQRFYEAIKLGRQQGQTKENLRRVQRILDMAPEESRALEEKIAILQEAGEKEACEQTRIELAQLYMRKDLAGKATRILEEAIEAGVSTPGPYQTLAELYLARGMQEKAIVQLEALAENLLSADKMEDAIGVYQRVLELEPKRAEARNRLALLFRHGGKIEDAIEQYFQIAQIYREKEMLGRAIRLYENILKLAPEKQKASQLLVKALLEKGDEQAAVDHLLQRAQAHIEADRFEPAEKDLLRALEIRSSEERILRQLALFYRERNKPAQALEHYLSLLTQLEERRDEEAVRQLCEEILEVDPNHPEVRARLEAFERESQQASERIGQPGSIQELIAQAHTCRDEGRYSEAIESLRSALLIETQDMSLWLELAEVYRLNNQEDLAAETLLRFTRRLMDQDQDEDALKVIQTAIEKDPKRTELLETQAQIELKMGAEEQALVSLQKLARLRPESAEAWQDLARLAERLEHEKQAVEAFRQAADRFDQSEELSSAGECLKSALRHVPEDTSLRLRLAELEIKTGDFSSALVERLQAAGILQKLNQQDESLKIVLDNLKIKPDHLPSLEVWFSQVSGKPENIKKDFDRALQLAEVYQSQGLVGKAIQHLDELRRLTGEDDRVTRLLVPLLQQTGEVHRALNLLMERGRNLAGQGETEKALECFQQAEEIVPDQAEPLLARLEIARSSENKAEQFALLERLAEQSSEKGLIGKQIDYLEQAWDLMPDKVEAGERLTEVYLAKGDEAKAVQTLERLGGLYRQKKQLDRYREVLKQVLQVQPANARARHQLAGVLLDNKQPEEAQEQLEQLAEQLLSTLPPADSNLYPVVEQTCRRLFEITGSSEHLHSLGHFYKSIEDFPSAQCAYHEALESCPPDRRGLAIQVCQDLLEVAPGESAVEQRLVDFYIEEDLPKEALAMLQALLERCLQQWEMASREKTLTQGPLVKRILDVSVRLLDLEPESEVVHQKMADFCTQIGSSDDAVAHWIALSEIYATRGDKSRAAETYRAILEVRPELLEVHVRLAEVLESQGHLDEALQEYLRLGQAFLEQKSKEQAQAAFERVADIDPEHQEALETLLLLARESKDRERIKALLLRLAEVVKDPTTRWREYLQEEPEDQSVRERYVRALLKEGRLEDLLSELKKLCHANRGQGQEETVLGLLSSAREQFPDSLPLYELSIEMLEWQIQQGHSKKLPAAMLNRLEQRLNEERVLCAEILIQNTQQRRAVEILEQVAAADEDNIPCRQRLAEVLEESQAEKSAGWWRELGEIHTRRGLLDRAQKAFEKALQLSPKAADVRQRLAEISSRRGSVEEATAQQRQLARQAMEENKPQAAAGALEKILLQLPEDRESLEWLAEHYAGADEKEKASAKAEVLLRLAERSNDHEGILRWTGFLLELNPQRADILDKRASTLVEVGRPEESAEILWQLALVVRKKDKAAEQGACLKLLDLGAGRLDLRREAAERLFEFNMERRARSELQSVAEAYLENKEPARANEIYRSLLRRYPEADEYHIALAEVLEKTGQGARAIERRLVLHEIYQKSDRPVEMVANLKAAMQIDPEQANLHRILGEVLVDLGNYREAVEHLLLAAGAAMQEQDRLTAVQCYRQVIGIDESHLEAHQRFHQLQSGCTLNEEEKKELLEVRLRLLRLMAEDRPEATGEIDQLAETLLPECIQNKQALKELTEIYQRSLTERAVGFLLKLLDRRIRQKDWQGAENDIYQLRRSGNLGREDLKSLVEICSGTNAAQLVLPERAALAAVYLENQELESAIAECEALSREEPERIEHRQALIESLDLAGHHSRSLKEKLLLAQILQQRGQIEQAEGCIRSALNYDQDNRDCLDQLAQLMIESGQPERARPVLVQLVELSEEQGDLAQALQYASRLVEFFPQEGERLECVARLQQAQGQEDQSYVTLLQAARAYAEEENLARAVELFRKMARQRPEKEEVRQELADLLWARGQTEQAIVEEKEIAAAYTRSGQIDKAITCYERMLKRDSQNPELMQELADFHLQQEQPAKAADLLSRLADHYTQREMLRRAQDILQRILTIQPAHREARRRLAELYIEKGMEEEGQNQLLSLARMIDSGEISSDDSADEIEQLGRRILSLGSKHMEPLTRLGQLMAERRKKDSAWAGQLYADIEVALAELHLAKAAVEDVEHCLGEAAKAQEDHPSIGPLRRQLEHLQRFQLPKEEFEDNLSRALEHWEHGEYGSASNLFEQLLRAQPDNLDLIFKLAECHIHLSDPGKAAELLDSKGQSFLTEHQVEPARKCFQMLLESSPAHLGAHMGLAKLALAEGDSQTAVRQYLHLADLAGGPEHGSLLLQALERAREIAPQREDILVQLAETYVRSGRIEEARESYRALADARRMAGRLDEAAEALQKGLQLDSEPRPDEAASHPKTQIARFAEGHYELAEILQEGARRREACEHWLAGAALALAASDFERARNGYSRVIESPAEEIHPEDLTQAFEGLSNVYVEWGNTRRAAETLSLLADHLESHQDLPQAINALEQAVRMDPESRHHQEKLVQLYQESGQEEKYIRASLQLAQCLIERDLIGRAEEVYRQLCSLPRWDREEAIVPDQGNPSYIEVTQPLLELCRDKGAPQEAAAILENLAGRYHRCGKLKEATGQLEQILQLLPDRPETLERLGQLHLEAGDTRAALSCMKQLASVLEQRGYLRRCAEVVLKIIENHPSDEDSLVSIQRLSSALGHPRQIPATLQEVFGKSVDAKCSEETRAIGATLLALEPHNDPVRMMLPETYVWEKQSKEACRQLDQLAGEYLQYRKPTLARQCLERALELSPDDKHLQGRLKNIDDLLKQENREERRQRARERIDELLAGDHPGSALEEIEAQLVEFPDDGQVLQWAADLYEAAGKGNAPFDRAGEGKVFEQWLRRGLQLGLQLAEHWQARTRTEDARRQAEHLLDLQPGYRPAAQLLLEILHESGDKREMLQVGRKIAAQLIDHQQLEPALETYLWLLDKAPDDPAVLGELAALQNKLGRKEEAGKTYRRQADAFLVQELFAQALTAYKQALALTPDNETTLQSIAQVYVVRGDVRGALAHYRKLLEHHLGRGQLSEAETVLSRMIALEPSQPGLRRERIDLYQRQGKITEARGEMENLARLYAEQELVNRAMEVWQEMIELEPEDRMVRQQLIEGYIQKGQHGEASRHYLEMAAAWEDRDEAFSEECMEKAAELSPEDPSVLRTLSEHQSSRGKKKDAAETFHRLAELQKQKGRLSEAAEALRQVLQFSPQDLEALENLAELYRLLKQPDREIPVLESLAQIYEKNQEKEKAIEVCMRVADYYFQVGVA